MSILRYEQPAGPAPADELPSAAMAVMSLLGILGLTVVLGMVGGVVVVSSDTESMGKAALLLLCLLPFACQGATLVWVIRPMWRRCRADGSLVAVAALMLGLLLFGFWLTLELSLLGAAVMPVNLD